MSAPQATPEPQHLEEVIRLGIVKFADSYTVTCQMCHKVLFAGAPADFNLTLETIVRASAWLHRH